MIRTGDADLTQARALHAAGVEYNNAGHPLRAIRLFQRALAMAEGGSAGSSHEGRLLAVRILISLAMSESELNGMQPGLAALTEAERRLDADQDPELLVLLELQHGYIQVRGGHLDRGLLHLDKAVTLIAHASPVHACTILLNRGSLHLYRGDLGRAREDLTRSAAIAANHHLVVEEFKARHNLGYLEYLAGNLALALRTMADALALDAGISLGVALLDRAQVLLQAGLHRESDDSLIEAAAIFRQDRLWKELGEVELARAECALLEGEILAARRLAASARARFRRRQNERWRRDAELVLLHAELAASRPGAQLAARALRLAGEFRDAGLTTQARTAQLVAAEALLRNGRLAQAQRVAVDAGPVRSHDPVSARLHTRLVRAKLCIAGDEPGPARREIRTGLAELANHQAQFGSIDLQTAGAVHGRRLVELDLSMALRQGRPLAVLAALERGRAISSRLGAVKAPADQVTAEQLAELRRAVEALRVIASDAEAAARASSQRRRVAELQRELRARSWQAEGPRDAGKPAGWDAIGPALTRADSSLVCYFTVEGELHAVVFGAGRPRTVRIAAEDSVIELARRTRADVDALSNGYLPPVMARAVASTLDRSLARLDAALLGALGLPDSRLVIVPTGVLATLPWTNLPSLRQRPVVVAPSATAWLAASASTFPLHPAVVAVAGPDLARSAEEAAVVGGLWPGATVVADGAGTRAALASALTSATVVHVAAHGQHSAENPLFSSIRLADGPLFAYELDQTARVAEHVVLSACELGRSTMRAGDEALGLTSVLLRLGSRSVISGVARVHDDVAAEVMTTYHTELAAGMDSAQSLALAVAKAPTPAPFVCFGATWATGIG